MEHLLHQQTVWFCLNKANKEVKEDKWSHIQLWRHKEFWRLFDNLDDEEVSGRKEDHLLELNDSEGIGKDDAKEWEAEEM